MYIFILATAAVSVIMETRPFLDRVVPNYTVTGPISYAR